MGTSNQDRILGGYICGKTKIFEHQVDSKPTSVLTGGGHSLHHTRSRRGILLCGPHLHHARTGVVSVTAPAARRRCIHSAATAQHLSTTLYIIFNIMIGTFQPVRMDPFPLPFPTRGPLKCLSSGLPEQGYCTSWPPALHLTLKPHAMGVKPGRCPRHHSAQCFYPCVRAPQMKHAQKPLLSPCRPEERASEPRGTLHTAPTMNVSVPASAPPTPPDTGASRKRELPFSAADLLIYKAVKPWP